VERVWVRALRLSDFRNYEDLELELGRGINFLTGPNGSGKTSILEAVSYLAVARSLRGANDAEVARWGTGSFGVSGDIVSDGTCRTSTLRYARGGRKEATLDGERAALLSDLVGLLRVAWFCPEDTWLTKGGPSERRKLLDMTLCQLDSAYLAALTNYRRTLRQRNEALLSWAPDEESERLVGVWTDRLIEYGSRVVAGRLALMPRLSEAVGRFHDRIAGGEPLTLRYKCTTADPAPSGEEGTAAERSSEDAARVSFALALERMADDERRRGFTLVGPHRDDLEVRLGGRTLRTFGSQGQHRTAAIALKLGEAEVLDSDGRGVVVLLDDIMSELDDRRSASLVGLVSGLGQALVTSTRPSPAVESVDGSVSFCVEAGEVVRR
jgi:DNA replication and repair protein RecF